MRGFLRYAAIAALLSVGSPAMAGPPYATDDPAPADPGQLESYVFVEGSIHHGSFDGEVEAEFNYGAARDLQLSLAVPVSLAIGEEHGVELGNVEAGVKWRFINDEASGFSLAFYPSIEVPTAIDAGGSEILVPLWGQIERGPWTLFGGGGRLLRTTRGARDSWTGGIALTRDVGGGATIGVEATAEGRDAPDSHGSKGLAVGGTFALGGPFAIVARGGPSFENDTGETAFDFFFGLQGLF